MTVVVLLSIALIIFFIYIYLDFRNSYKTWEKLKVPFVPPAFPFGNFSSVMRKEHFGIVCQNIYNRLRDQSQYGGIYLFKEPCLIAIHLDFVKQVLVDDFDSFNERGLTVDLKHNPVTDNVYFLAGLEWRNMKQKLLSGFNANHIRTNFKTLSEIGEKFEEYLVTADLQGREYNVEDLMTGFTADALSSLLFGVEGNNIGNPQSEFRIAGQKLSLNPSKWSNSLKLGQSVLSHRSSKLYLDYSRFDKQSMEYFTQILHKTIGFRKENNLHRNDFLQAIIEMMDNNAETRSPMSFDKVVANIITFFYLSYKSCAITMSYALYQLAQNKGVQIQLRWEMEQVLNQFEGKLNYDSLSRMQLLERIVLESLRMNPPFVFLQRLSKERYQLPNKSKIPRGTQVIIPILAIHYDPEIYPNPKKFDPDRFAPECITKRHPLSYLPFGNGPRTCLGQRLAMLVIKMGLVSILRKYSFDVGEKTQIPLQFDSRSVHMLEPKNGVWLKLNSDSRSPK